MHGEWHPLWGSTRAVSTCCVNEPPSSLFVRPLRRAGFSRSFTEQYVLNVSYVPRTGSAPAETGEISTCETT